MVQQITRTFGLTSKFPKDVKIFVDYRFDGSKSIFPGLPNLVKSFLRQLPAFGEMNTEFLRQKILYWYVFERFQKIIPSFLCFFICSKQINDI